jgi:hypothetical protein
LAKPLTAAVDQVVTSRYEAVVDIVDSLRAEHPTRPPADLADLIIARYRRELGAMGAASGGIAAVPGIGTGIMVAGSVSETGWSVVRLGQMILELGVVYGHDARNVGERRAWVLAVMALALGAADGLQQTAGIVVRRGGGRCRCQRVVGQPRRRSRRSVLQRDDDGPLASAERLTVRVPSYAGTGSSSGGGSGSGFGSVSGSGTGCAGTGSSAGSGSCGWSGMTAGCGSFSGGG